MSTLHLEMIPPKTGDPKDKVMVKCLEKPCVDNDVKFVLAFADVHTLVHGADHIDLVV